MNKILLENLRSYFKSQQIPVSMDELSLQLFSHPHADTLYGIADTLDFLNIENVAAQVEKDQLSDLPVDFLAHIDQKDKPAAFVHVRRKPDGVELVRDGLRLSIGEFKDAWDGVVLLAQKTDATVTNRGLQTETWLFILVAILILSTFWNSLAALVLSILSLLGIRLSREIFVTAHENGSFLSQKICGVNNEESCGKLLKSNGYNLGRFSPNDLLFSFFATTILSLSLFEGIVITHLLYMIVASLVAIIAIVLQAFVIKVWCRLCLIGSFLIFSQLCVVYFYMSESEFLGLHMSYINQMAVYFILYGIIYAAVLLSINSHRTVTIKNKQLFSAEMELLKFKRNPDILGYVLREAQRVSDHSPAHFIIGNHKAKHHVSLVISLTCKFCSTAFLKFYEVYRKRKNELKFELIFNHADLSKSQMNDVLVSLIAIKNDAGVDDFLTTLAQWFKEQNVSEILRLQPNVLNNQGYDILKEQRKWCEVNKLYHTPVLLINGSIIPYYYDMSFLDDFISLVDE